MKVFVASSMPTSYPLKLQKPSTFSKRIRNTAETFIFDSGIGDDTTNDEILDAAHACNADYVVAKDVLHDFEKTTRNIIEFQQLYKNHPCKATPLIPVQCDPENDRWHVDHVNNLPEFDHYVLGGMAVDEVSTTDQIKSIKRFREHVGYKPYVHGLGVGGGMEFVSKVAGTGWLDSVDCSTPEQAAMFGAILDKRLRQKDIMTFPGGEGKSNRTYALAEFNSWQIHDVWQREAKQTGLANYE